MLNPFQKSKMTLKSNPWAKKQWDNWNSLVPKGDIIKVYERLVGGPMRHTGRATIVKCCFHDDNKPSLALYKDTSSFYCFSCNIGGDIYKFVQKVMNCDYKTALGIIKDSHDY